MPSSASRSAGSSGGRGGCGFSLGESTCGVTSGRTQQRARSAPAASNRGRMVSPMSSSALSRMTSPTSGRAPSGNGEPVVTLAAMVRVRVDLPVPGSPSSTVTLPRGTRPGHNHRTCSRSTSATRTRSSLTPPALRSATPTRTARQAAAAVVGTAARAAAAGSCRQRRHASVLGSGWCCEVVASVAAGFGWRPAPPFAYAAQPSPPPLSPASTRRAILASSSWSSIRSGRP
jgi:hypothetical protein